MPASFAVWFAALLALAAAVVRLATLTHLVW